MSDLRCQVSVPLGPNRLESQGVEGRLVAGNGALYLLFTPYSGSVGGGQAGRAGDGAVLCWHPSAGVLLHVTPTPLVSSI